MLAYLFVMVAVAIRLLPHPFFFTPVAASLLFFGARRPFREMWFPVLLLAGSDVVLTRYYYGYPVPADHIVTWAWYGLALGLGMLLRNRTTIARLAGASLAASLSFFAVSNFAVWAVWNMYPKTLSGLAACYAAGIPFFRNSLAGDLFFTAVLFGIGMLAGEKSSAHKPVEI
jgi:hypothetical protein